MAINYLNTVDLNKNQLNNAAIQNLASNPATGVLGQIYYNTTDSELKVCVTASTVGPVVAAVWGAVGGGVESIDLLDSIYVSLVNTGTPAIPELEASLSAIDGTAVAATRFLSKDNTWDIPTVDNYGYWVLDADGNGATANIGPGDTADFIGGLKITTESEASGALNITHNLQTQTDSTSAVSPAYGASFTVVDSVTRDTTGHATGLNVKTVTLPAAATVSNATITLTGGAGLVDLGGTFTLNQAADKTITFNVGAGAGIQSNTNDVAIKYSGAGNIIDAAADGTVIATTDKILYEDVTDSIVKEIAISSLASLINTNTTYTLPTSAGAANTAIVTLTPGGSGGGGGSVTFSGTVDQIAVTETVGATGTVTIGLPDNVIIAGELTVSGDLIASSDAFFNGTAFEISASTAIAFGANKITNVADPTSNQDAATKNYVDSSNVGQLIYQGGYNASTNVPNLDTITNIAIKRGFTYTVTVDGLFFTEQVRVGDLLVANVDIPANSGTNALGNWTTVQNNVDLASLTQIGIGNVIADASVEYDGLRVVYSNGTATVGLDINSLPTETLNFGPSDIIIPYVNDTNGEQKKASLDDLVLTANVATSKKGTIPVGDLFGTVTVPASWGFDTMVQTRNAAGDTVFCDVTRTSTSVTATISTAQTALTGGIITILVQKIG